MRSDALTRVFLSHSSRDATLARTLAVDLQKANINVWLDQWEIGVGDEVKQVIFRGVDDCDFIVVLLTRQSIESDWVGREWRRKFESEADTQRVSIIPVRGEQCEIPDFLADRSFADIFGGSYWLGLVYLLDILRHHSSDDQIETPATPITTPGSTSHKFLSVVTPISVEISADLGQMFESLAHNRTSQLAKEMRDKLFDELGVLFPGISFRINETDMPLGAVVIMLEEIPAAFFEIDIDSIVADVTIDALMTAGIDAISIENKATGRQGSRINADDRHAVEAAGFRTWNAATYLFDVLKAVLKLHAKDFIDIQTTFNLVKSVSSNHPQFIAEVVPKIISWFELTEVLQLLVREEISIVDLPGILLAMSHRDPDELDTATLAEQARHALRNQISEMYSHGCNVLPVLRLDSLIEQHFCDAIKKTPTAAYLEFDPEITQQILTGVRNTVMTIDTGVAESPILTLVEVRPFMRRLVELEFPALHVLSHDDLNPNLQTQTIATISLSKVNWSEAQ